jgi:hypothetical protein
MTVATIEQKLMELKRAKLARYKSRKYESYVPIGKTEKFLDLLGSTKYKAVAYLAANGVGKTAALANIVANIVFPSKNPYFQQELFQNYSYLKRIRIVSEATTVTEAIIPALKEWLPEGRYTTDKRGKYYEAKWYFDNGFELDIMTYDQDLKQFESANLGIVLLDEPPSNAIFKACISRLRRGGVLGVVCTPLMGSAWLYDGFVANPNMEAEFKAVVTAEVEDACKIHGVRGFLDHDEILKMIAQYSEDDKQARIFGKFQHLVGLVFKKWNREVHVIKPFDINKDNFCVVEALDTHPRNPDAYLQVAIDRHGTKYVIDELYQNGAEDELAARIKLKREGKRIVKSLLEPGAFTEDQHESNETKNSLAKRLQKLGLYFVAGSKRRQDALRRIKEALNFQETKGRIIQPPELYVFDTCQRTIWEIEHWQWDDWRGSTADNKSPREKPQDKDDHIIEDLGRILLEEQKFVENVTTQYNTHRELNLDPFA